MDCDTLIIGAGAAGMMCAAHAKGRTFVVDHAKAPGEKIRISGGGRCNFTNLHVGPHAFLSQNPHFAKSALARYTQWDFIDLIAQHDIAWHEKTLGQLFCDTSAKEIVAMLRALMTSAGATLSLETSVARLEQTKDGFTAQLSGARQGPLRAKHVVIATGGKSIPKMGATGFAYDIARQFGLHVTETRPALVPFTFPDRRFADLAGIAAPARVTAGGTVFDEAMLFTHRGLSGPAILQASSYWQDGEDITLNLDPENTLPLWLKETRKSQGKKQMATILATRFPARLATYLAATLATEGRIGDWSDARITALSDQIQNWHLTPQGTEGYRTAEVTLGGISTQDLDAKTLQSKSTPGLYFIGECVDVTGWLGGYNFQWAWASAMATARALG